MASSSAGPACGWLLVSRPGPGLGTNPVRLRAGGIVASAEVGRHGALSAFVPTTAALDAGLDDALGWWVYYHHPTFGPWFGVLSRPEWSAGETEIAAESGHVLLRKRRAPERAMLAAASPGQHALRLLRDAEGDGPLWLTGKRIDEDGPLLLVDARGEDLCDVALPRLAELDGHEWDVTPERVFRFRRRIGADTSASVHLVEGGAVVDHRFAPDLWTVENDLTAVGRPDAAVRVTAFDPASVAAYGRRQGSRTYEDIGHPATAAARVRADLAASAVPRQTVELTVADVGGVWATFREGDSVLVTLPSANFRGRCRVMVRAVDVDAGTMAVSADVEERL